MLWRFTSTQLRERHAAAVKHPVIRAQKARGVVNAYRQLKIVTTTKELASAHAMKGSFLNWLRTSRPVVAIFPKCFRVSLERFRSAGVAQDLRE